MPPASVVRWAFHPDRIGVIGATLKPFLLWLSSPNRVFVFSNKRNESFKLYCVTLLPQATTMSTSSWNVFRCRLVAISSLSQVPAAEHRAGVRVLYGDETPHRSASVGVLLLPRGPRRARQTFKGRMRWTGGGVYRDKRLENRTKISAKFCALRIVYDLKPEKNRAFFAFDFVLSKVFWFMLQPVWLLVSFSTVQVTVSKYYGGTFFGSGGNYARRRYVL